MRSIPRITAATIHTMTGSRLGHSASGGRKYLRLAKLAFEREHRDRDIQTTSERIAGSQGRLAEIEAEEACLLASIKAGRRGQFAPSSIPPRTD